MRHLVKLRYLCESVGTDGHDMPGETSLRERDPIVWLPLLEASWIALVTSSAVMISASSGVLAQPVRAERGPDLPARYRH